MSKCPSNVRVRVVGGGRCIIANKQCWSHLVPSVAELRNYIANTDQQITMKMKVCKALLSYKLTSDLRLCVVWSTALKPDHDKWLTGLNHVQCVIKLIPHQIRFVYYSLLPCKQFLSICIGKILFCCFSYDLVPIDVKWTLGSRENLGIYSTSFPRSFWKRG